MRRFFFPASSSFVDNTISQEFFLCVCVLIFIIVLFKKQHVVDQAFLIGTKKGKQRKVRKKINEKPIRGN